MRPQDFSHLIAPAVTSVLETMFFSEPHDPADFTPDAADLEAHLHFSGEASGMLGIRISEPAARGLAASFLGEFEESLTEAQIAQVVCELSNMLCGWIVSKAGSHACFNLGSPELLSAERQQPAITPVFQQSFAVEQGVLTVSLYTSELV